ncbi:MAG: PqqD family protein, partial [Tabrizicola sp.]
CLAAGFAEWPDDGPTATLGEELAFQLARFDGPDLAPRSDDDPIRQRMGTIAEEIGNTLYLADPEGLAIHRMDALASVIWSVLEDPVTPQDILDLLLEAFPETDAAKVATDVQALLAMLHGARLIETVARA